jgi:hypothetical protein
MKVNVLFVSRPLYRFLYIFYYEFIYECESGPTRFLTVHETFQHSFYNVIKVFFRDNVIHS